MKYIVQIQNSPATLCMIEADSSENAAKEFAKKGYTNHVVLVASDLGDIRKYRITSRIVVEAA